MQLNNAMFSNNGRCGYILKPAYLRDAMTEKEALPATISRSHGHSPISLTIDVRKKWHVFQIFITTHKFL